MDMELNENLRGEGEGRGGEGGEGGKGGGGEGGERGEGLGVR